MNKAYDVCVIGAGVVGCAVARELSMYDIKVCVAERCEDICSGTSKANSAIVHAGYDAVPGTVKAKMNVRGAELIRQLSKTLDFSYEQCGSLVLCFDKNDEEKLYELYERGLKNGVQQLRIISKDEARLLEPALSGEVVSALYAPTAGIVCPFGMTAAFAENAAANGVDFIFNTCITDIVKTDDGYEAVYEGGSISAKYIVNAAGVYSDDVHNYVCDDKLKIIPRKGEYVLLDKQAGRTVRHTVFQLPGRYGKGVLVTPTVHGNLLIGPDAVDIDDKENTMTTQSGTLSVKQRALQSVPDIPYGLTITGFTGIRAHEVSDDFIIGEDRSAEGFFDAAGIESPGLTSAPAIGEYLCGLIVEKCGARLRCDRVTTRKGIPEVAKLPVEERARLIADDPAYGNIVCRCENISEGEIRDAILRKPGAVSMDGVKRRVRQGMGRCQAGFCTPGAVAILARYLGTDEDRVTKNRPGSELIKG